MDAASLKQLFEPFEKSRIAITVSDLGAKDRPLIYVNRGFEVVTGYQAQDVVGRNCRFLQGPASNPETITAMRTAIDNERAINVCLANYRADGTLFHNLLILAPISGGDGSKLFLGCQYDITERIQFAKIGDHIQELNGVVDRLRALPKTTWQVHMDTSHTIANLTKDQAEYYLRRVSA